MLASKALTILLFIGIMSIFGIPLMLLPDSRVKMCGFALVVLGIFAIIEVFTNREE